MSSLSQAEQKALVGKVAIERLIERGVIHSSMKLGLGTGSTVEPAIRTLASFIQSGAVRDIKIVATSLQTENLCADLALDVYSFRNRLIDGTLDLTIDGADSVDPNGSLIKGGGAALLREKVAAYNSATYVIIVDESKLCASMGSTFPLPVEFVSEAYVSVKNRLQSLGAKVTLREGVRKCGPVITDNGNQIIDCLWPKSVDPVLMEDVINGITGVVDNGFFTKKHPTLFIATSEGKVMER